MMEKNPSTTGRRGVTLGLVGRRQGRERSLDARGKQGSYWGVLSSFRRLEEVALSGGCALVKKYSEIVDNC